MDIFSYIKSQENSYNTIPVPIVDNYEWNMAKHVKLTTLYLNSRYETGDQDNKPFKNIILPKINLEHRAVEFAVKEIDFFVDDSEQYYKSFLVRKYHEKWARVNDLAGFLDDMTETYTDYGGVLVEKVRNSVPTVVPFQELAFVDQTNILSGPICKKLQYTPDKLKEMEAKGWGKFGTTIDELLALALNQKTSTQVNGRTIETPMKYVEVYDLYGVLPAKYLYDAESDNVTVSEYDYVNQQQVIAFYRDHTGEKQGVTLFKGKAKPGRYKFYKRDPIFGRALGRGGVEELFEPQVWVNYSEIQKKELLDQASKLIYQTTDGQFHTRNNLSLVEQGEVLITKEGSTLNQVNTTPINITAFENALTAWDNTAKEISASFDTISGADNKSGTPFRLGLLLNQEAHSLHQYRKGKLGGQFLPELYRDWIIPEIQKDLSSGDSEFMANLSLDEMSAIAEQVVTDTVNKTIVQKILSGTIIDYGEVDALKQTYKDIFYKKGNKKFFKIFKDELKDLPIDIEVNVTGEEKNKALMAEKMGAVFSQIAQNPALLDDPRMSKLFNEILEASGLSPLAYSTKKAPVAPTPNAQVTGPAKSPISIPQAMPENVVA
jgi:hypothetical protein